MDDTTNDFLAAFQPAPWMRFGACRRSDPDLFFTRRGDSRAVRAAKAVCKTCPVKAECANYAAVNGERFGIWGGLTEQERRRMRRAALRLVS